jgi:F0F1-type ATP synthase membrane subunit a
MQLSPDEILYWQYGFFKLNATIVFTWVLMLILTIGSKLITRNLSTDHTRSRWQNLLEIIVTGIENQVEEVGLSQPRKYIGFLGTLFFFVRCHSKSIYHRTWLSTTNGIALNHNGFGSMRAGSSTAVWNHGTRIRRLPKNLYYSDDYHAAVQLDQ